MQIEEDYDLSRPGQGWATSGTGLLRNIALIALGAMVLAIIITPMLDGDDNYDIQSFMGQGGVDRMATGSVNAGGGSYTIRRSVLQASPDSICVIRANGLRSGDC